MTIYKLSIDIEGNTAEFHFFERRTAEATAEFFNEATKQDIKKLFTIEEIEPMTHQRALDDLLECLNPNTNPNIN